MQRKFDEIVEFSGVEQFIDTPVKRYSSGMYVRLAFAVAAHLEPEILIVDEVLAVGDAEFQKRCLGKMGEVAQDGRTVLFVSHNMQAVRRLCSAGILLENGQVVDDGPTSSRSSGAISPRSSRRDSGRRRWDEPAERPGDDLCRVVEVRVTDDEGEPAGSFFSRNPIHVVLELEIAAPSTRRFIAGFDLATADGVVVFRSYTTDVCDDAGAAARPRPERRPVHDPAGAAQLGPLRAAPADLAALDALDRPPGRRALVRRHRRPRRVAVPQRPDAAGRRRADPRLDGRRAGRPRTPTRRRRRRSAPPSARASGRAAVVAQSAGRSRRR